MTTANSLISCSLLIFATACSSGTPAPDSTAPTASSAGPAAASADRRDTARSLEGTTWRLIEIASMDDSVYTPDDRDKYTLAFEADGTLAVRADCNRGRGSWTREGESGLQFGPIAVTRMACPPDSLDQRFLSNLEYVRSFVERDGHIYLATMADGAILEFEPAPGDSAPAFDCSKAEGEVETLICADAELAAMDVKLDALYRNALESFPPDAIDGLKAFQRGWIKGRNDCWKSEDVRDCVVQEYAYRTTELQIRTGALEVAEPVGFSCDDEQDVTVVFYATTALPAAVLTRGADEQVIAYRVPAASGAKYQGRNVTFWTQGDEATLTWGKPAMRCRQR